jgi:isopentenyl phosphate kinase
LTIIKLGGSVITHKEKVPPQLNYKTLNHITDELADCDDNLIIVLGGGSYGHQTAHQYGYGNQDTPKEKLLEGIGPIRDNMTELSNKVKQEFSRKDIKSIVLPPFTHVLLNNREISSYSTEIIERSLNSGYRVITHGDVCFDNSLGASILSGDTIISYLAKHLHADRVFIGTNVDGVLEQNPDTNPNAKHIPIITQSNMSEVLQLAGTSNTTDVTGGMHRKITELIDLAEASIKIYIFNLAVPGRLESLIKEKQTICTIVSL